MPVRSNALSELTRFWLQSKHEYLIDEAVPVPVPYNLSDLDLVALHPRGRQLTLPRGVAIGPRLIVETKDEHDWEPTGRQFGAALRSDVAKMAGGRTIPRGTRDVKFTMLREEHYERACEIFGSDGFDRLFVVHALDPDVLRQLGPHLAVHRIHWLTVRELVLDLTEWYGEHKRPSGLRQTLVGDLFHLLVGYCGMSVARPAGPAEKL